MLNATEIKKQKASWSRFGHHGKSEEGGRGEGTHTLRPSAYTFCPQILFQLYCITKRYAFLYRLIFENIFQNLFPEISRIYRIVQK